MKPFNLEEYLKYPSKKLVTRDGRKARIICTNRLMEDFPICALVTDNGEEYYFSYTINGKYHSNADSVYDLFFAPEKKEGWINIYRNFYNNSFYVSNTIYETKEEAKKKYIYYKNYISTIKIEWEE